MLLLMRSFGVALTSCMAAADESMNLLGTGVHAFRAM